MKPVKIYLTRHGQTNYNLQERMQGHTDTELNEEGIKQAMALAERIKNDSIDYIISSPLVRAHKTAMVINEHHKIPLKLDDRLKEMGFGTWEGQEIQKIKDTYEKEAYSFWKAPETYEPIDGESFENVQGRVVSFLNDLVKTHSGETVLIVCHGMLIRNILSVLKDESVATVWKHPRIYQTCLTIVDYDGIRSDFKMLADASHYDF